MLNLPSLQTIGIPCYFFSIKRNTKMANGKEDLEEKNKDKIDISKDSSKIIQWANFQGREDCEMLQEKSRGWSATKSSRGDYDDED